MPSANQRLHGATSASAVGCTGSWYLSTNKRLTGRLGLLLKVVREAGVVCYLMMHGEIRFDVVGCTGCRLLIKCCTGRLGLLL